MMALCDFCLGPRAPLDSTLQGTPSSERQSEEEKTARGWSLYHSLGQVTQSLSTGADTSLYDFRTLGDPAKSWVHHLLLVEGLRGESRAGSMEPPSRREGRGPQDPKPSLTRPPVRLTP